MLASQVRWFALLTVLLSYIRNSVAIDLPLISDTPGLPYVCAAVKAGKNTGDSFIAFNLTSARTLSEQSSMAVAIFNFEDLPVLGEFVHGFYLKYCDKYEVQDMSCDRADLGLFYSTGPTLHKFITFNQTSLGVMNTRYDIEEDGKYCVVVHGGITTEGTAHFSNGFGQLSVEEFEIMNALRLLFFFDIIILGFYLNLVKAGLEELLPIHWSTIKLLCIMNIVAFFQWMEYEVKNVKSPPLYFSIFCEVLLFIRDNARLYFLALLTTRYGIIHNNIATKRIRFIQYSLLAKFICDVYRLVSFRLDYQSSLGALLSIALGLIVKIKISFPFWRTFCYLKRQRSLLKNYMYTNIRWLFGAILTSDLLFLYYSINDAIIRHPVFVPEVNEKNLYMGTFIPEFVNNISFCTIFFLWRPANVEHYFKETLFLDDEENSNKLKKSS
ncbi:hypothetical protein RNJ44_03981 [Nakaseomyces bracarensis]|uniref:PTM1-like N-terminal domain-containing protein n=1 Tax=Nakaseomyces bracarensis TaxID=273131 RepID=A0ABR4NTK4_9SACH